MFKTNILLVIVFFSPINILTANPISHTEWMERARKKNLQTVENILILEQSRLRVKESFGKILPSLNLETIIDTSISGPLGLLSGLGNLIGVLLPSRWFQWNESKMYYMSQYYSFMSLRGNYLLLAEEMYLNLKKNYRVYAQVSSYHEDLMKISSSVEFREKIGELPRGSFAKLKLKQLSIEKSLIELKNLNKIILIEMNAFIANGDVSPSQITEIEYEKDRPRTSIAQWNFDEIKNNIVELKSAKAMVVASQYSKRSRIWGFLSPHDQGFGYNTFLQSKISSVELNQVIARYKLIYEQFKLNFNKINLDQQQLELVQENTIDMSNVIYHRKREIEAEIQFSGQYDMEEYLNILDDHLQINIQKISNQIHDEYLWAQKERFLLIGFYTQLDDIIPFRDRKKLKKYQKKEDKMIGKIGDILL